MTLYEYLVEICNYNAALADQIVIDYIDGSPLSITYKEDINAYNNSTYCLE